MGSTSKLLANQYKNILSDPVEGFTVELLDEASLFEWRVFLEGPKDTCYESGVFELRLSFPKDYPMNPPTLKFISEFWHPNVYNDGKVCMSILHPPGDDAMSGELARERWLPTQSVTTIILSLMSLLNDPNCSSPANVDASVEWRKNRDSYISKCRKLVERANREKPAHIKIPHPDTNEEEHKKIVQKWKEMNTDMGAEDFYEHHEENESEPEEESDDENENEFLESNEEMNSEDSESAEEVDRKKKKKNGAESKEEKGKSAEISLEVAKSDDSEKRSTTTSTETSKASDLVPVNSTSNNNNNNTLAATAVVPDNPLPPEKAPNVVENNNAVISLSGPSSPPSIPPANSSSSSNSNQPSRNNNEISVDNANASNSANNNSNNAPTDNKSDKNKKNDNSKNKQKKPKSKKKKCIIM